MAVPRRGTGKSGFIFPLTVLGGELEKGESALPA